MWEVSKRTDLNGDENSRACIICNFGYFSDVNFEYETQVCNNCYDLIMKDLSYDEVVCFCQWYDS